jgi:hypothetical protein
MGGCATGLSLGNANSDRNKVLLLSTYSNRNGGGPTDFRYDSAPDTLCIAKRTIAITGTIPFRVSAFKILFMAKMFFDETTLSIESAKFAGGLREIGQVRLEH